MSIDAASDGGLTFPAGYERLILDEVESTMAEAARQIGALAGPTWIMARRQTAARGRQGRPWDMCEGSFAATLVFRPEGTLQQAAKRSFCASVALFETLALYVDRTKLSLKWPNDVLLNEGKVAGILLESAGRGHFVDWLAIGVGVNLTEVPGAVTGAFPPVSLSGEGGQVVKPETFLTVLADAYATQEDKLATFGFPRIREDWLRHAARVGETITARTPREQITGVFDTLDQDGNLILQTADGPRAIAAADVFFGGGADASGD